jgi:hypothetical protein
MSTTLAHSGLPSGTTRFDLLRLFEQVARPGFGLSSTAVALVRQYVLKTMDADYHSRRICAVWTQACRFAEALGLTPRSINSAERELEATGFIVRNAGINGERNGDRHDGVITWAAGMNLAPLVDRFVELKAKAEALVIQARAIRQCRAEIRQLGHRIREAGDADLRERAETILPDGRTARIGSIERLTAIREALSAMLQAIESAPTPNGGALKTSDASEETVHPIYRTKNHHEGVPRAAAIRWRGSGQPRRLAWPPRATAAWSRRWADRHGPILSRRRGSAVGGLALRRAPGGGLASSSGGSGQRCACC